MKWLVGGIAFFLPTMTTIVGTTVLRWIMPEAFWGSLIVAAIIPPILVLQSKVRWRVLLAFGTWMLLAVQFCVILAFLLAGFRG